jgi:exonuclease SbcC
MLDDAGTWSPAALPDGTVSDGKVETYARCVEAICGPADTFFTSVFSAQGKRQLSTYRNGEIKALLADLLGQEDIRALGQKAGETARQLKAALAALRAEATAFDAERQRLEMTPVDGRARTRGSRRRKPAGRRPMNNGRLRERTRRR